MLPLRPSVPTLPSTPAGQSPCPLFQVGPSVAGEVLTLLNHHPAILFSEICDSSRDPQIACYNFSSGAAERWQSGRMYLTRNQAYVQTYRGFESLPKYPIGVGLMTGRITPMACNTRLRNKATLLPR